MKKLAIIVVLATTVFFISRCTDQDKPPAPHGGDSSVAGVPDSSNTSQAPFPDFGYMLPADAYTGPVFHLSQDYPTRMPDTSHLPDFFQMDFRKDWKAYLEAVQKYCLEGNIEVNFRVQDNSVRKWYHMPWQHYGPFGREGFHGLTKEAPIAQYQLASTQTDSNIVTWAVGFYNEPGGYMIGRVWKDHRHPNPDNIAFPVGTVVFKILFVSVPAKKVTEQVPSLVNPIQWTAYITPTFNSQLRDSAKVTLIQMDVMVRDNRAPFGWVFGNFQYNGKTAHSNPWYNLVPVGVMWGDDPENNTNFANPRPVKTIINDSLKETIINPDAMQLPPTHLGWNSRLNGPVDNPMSSCYSCHGTAEYPQLSPISPLFQANPPAPGSPEWMRWFQNIRCGQAFDSAAKSTDFSLQLAASLQNFEEWNTAQGGIYASVYQTKTTLRSMSLKAELVKPKVYSIRRSELLNKELLRQFIRTK
ncbi:MAG: hypothetical protein J0H74_15145 [Chitinophagaceae bacterium]|nr:hypothetical protein [Chitinophagaceae bacterium]